MKEVVLKIPDKKYDFFMELMRSLKFVTIVKDDDGDSKEEIVTNLKEAVAEMKLIKAGKKLQRAQMIF